MYFDKQVTKKKVNEKDKTTSEKSLHFVLVIITSI